MTAFGKQIAGTAIRTLAAGLVLACLSFGPASATEPQSIRWINNGDIGTGGKYGKADDIGLGSNLGVAVDGEGVIDPSKYVLFLNDFEIDGLTSKVDADNRTIIFSLQRNAKNTDNWKTLLGSLHALGRQMRVSLGVASAAGSTTPTIKAKPGNPATFWFVAISAEDFVLSGLAIAVTLFLVWGGARRTTILKDNQIPQIDPARQCYSLGRTQMAFWFTLIFASYIFLWIVLLDVNTLTEQALMLMGISGATALAAVTIDAVKDSPADAVNAGLRALGIKNYTDVIRIKAEIAQRSALLAANPPPAQALADQLSSEIQDRMNLLRTYETAIAGFTSTGWYSDIVSDVNGPALHRLQVLCWSALLGLIFLIGVWQNLTMPAFSTTLLALMGISGAGYVGFKYPEAQQ